MSNKPGRNSICDCGSKKKYKHCHGKKVNPLLPTQQNKNEQAVFISAFAESLHGRRLGRNKDEAHTLLIGYSILHRRLGRALARCLNNLEKYEERRTKEGWNNSNSGSVTEHLDDYLDCAYAASEIYEFYNKDVIKFLQLEKDVYTGYKSELKKIRRESALICNQCKHEHAFLQAIDVLYDNGNYVVGFCVYQKKDQCNRINSDTHLNKEAFSLNWALRRLVANLIAAEVLAAGLVSKAQDSSSEKIETRAYSLPYFEDLRRIIKRPVYAMPQEITKPTITIATRNYIDLEFDPLGPPKQGKGKIMAYFDILGEGTNCEIPYKKGEISARVTNNSKPGHPFPGFMRVQVKDVIIEDN